MKNFLYFFVWLSKRIFLGVFGGTISLYKKYDRFVVTEPGMALFPTLFVSLGLLVISAALMVATGNTNMKGLYFIQGVFCIWVCNYFRILMREQYRKYLKEQQDFIDILKK